MARLALIYTTLGERVALTSASLSASSSMAVEKAFDRDNLEDTAHAGVPVSEAFLLADRHSTPSQASAPNLVNTTQPPLSWFGATKLLIHKRQ